MKFTKKPSKIISKNKKSPSSKSLSKSSNKNIKETKKKTNTEETRGRNSKYGTWMNDVAKRLAMQGFIDKDIYDVLGIAEVTGIDYKKKFPEFAKALNEGKATPNSIAERRLFKLVKGYEYDSEQIVVVNDGLRLGSHIERVPIKKRVEPNLGAIKEYLHNRDPNRWKERRSVELDNTDDDPFVIVIK